MRKQFDEHFRHKYSFIILLGVLQLAKKLHPDTNKDDADAERKFQEVQRVYEVLFFYFFNYIILVVFFNEDLIMV